MKDFFWLGFWIGVVVGFGFTCIIFEISYDDKYKSSYGMVEKAELSSVNADNERVYKIKIRASERGDNDELWFYTQRNYKIGDTIRIE